MQASDDLSQRTQHILEFKRKELMNQIGFFEDTVLPLKNPGYDTEIRCFPGLWYGICNSIFLSEVKFPLETTVLFLSFSQL